MTLGHARPFVMYLSAFFLLFFLNRLLEGNLAWNLERFVITALVVSAVAVAVRLTEPVWTRWLPRLQVWLLIAIFVAPVLLLPDACEALAIASTLVPPLVSFFIATDIRRKIALYVAGAILFGALFVVFEGVVAGSVAFLYCLSFLTIISEDFRGRVRKIQQLIWRKRTPR